MNYYTLYKTWYKTAQHRAKNSGNRAYIQFTAHAGDIIDTLKDDPANLTLFDDIMTYQMGWYLARAEQSQNEMITAYAFNLAYDMELLLAIADNI